MKESHTHNLYPDIHHGVYSRTIFGFWIYLWSDFMLFATLVASYAVLYHGTFGGPGAAQIFNPTFALIQTLVLLLSTFTIGLGGAFAHRENKSGTIAMFAITFVLGMIFMGMEAFDYATLINAGNGWQRSAFLSAYFTLVGTHSLHMIFALLWIIVLIIPVCIHGVSFVSVKRLTCLKMFWQFLNIIWIAIYSIVYLIGVS